MSMANVFSPKPPGLVRGRQPIFLGGEQAGEHRRAGVDVAAIDRQAGREIDGVDVVRIAVDRAIGGRAGAAEVASGEVVAGGAQVAGGALGGAGAERGHQLGGARRAGVIAAQVLALEQLVEQRDVPGVERLGGGDRGGEAGAGAILVAQEEERHVAERFENKSAR